MAIVVLRPGETLEIRFADHHSVLMKSDSLNVLYYPTFTPEVRIDKVTSSKKPEKLCEVVIDE